MSNTEQHIATPVVCEHDPHAVADRRDSRNLIGGAALCVVGIACAYYALTEYEFGSLSRMGPGFFPAVVAAALAVIGLLLMLSAPSARSRAEPIEWRTGLLVTGSILAFTLGLEVAGLAPATALAALLSSLADRETSWRARLVLAVAVMIVTALVFQVGLGMTLPLWRLT